MNHSHFIQPNWPAPTNIHAYTTLRSSGVSNPPNNQLDRDHLIKLFNLPTEPVWLRQVHGATVLPAIPANREQAADASFSAQPQQVCLIQTADCLPILLCHRSGSHVAAIHAGWRGLEKNIIAETVKALNVSNDELLAWIGPGISQPNFEVGEEVRNLFINDDPDTTSAFIVSPNQRWLADLNAIAALQLKKLGITAIYGGDRCTYADSKNFFSYRRDGAGTGRIVSMIWID
jgi:YfiH family protein